MQWVLPRRTEQQTHLKVDGATMSGHFELKPRKLLCPFSEDTGLTLI